ESLLSSSFSDFGKSPSALSLLLSFNRKNTNADESSQNQNLKDIKGTKIQTNTKSKSKQSSSKNREKNKSIVKPSLYNNHRVDFLPVYYDEKVVLLTDRALYICTYD